MLDERGISLTEALTAATLSVIAVIGLAYSFGVGRSLVDRYEIARAALGEAQTQLESMSLWSRTASGWHRVASVPARVGAVASPRRTAASAGAGVAARDEVGGEGILHGAEACGAGSIDVDVHETRTSLRAVS